MYQKLRRVMAIVAIVILVSMYLVTLILAIVLPQNAMKLFFAAVIMTVFIPIILWIILASIRYALRNREELAAENAERIKEADAKLDADRAVDAEDGKTEE